MRNDTNDWAVFDRLGLCEPFTDLQYNEARELAREWSESFGPLLKEGQPTDRYYAAIDTDKLIQARICVFCGSPARHWIDGEPRCEQCKNDRFA